jgi:tRNA-specific 2-thiouridylase
MTKNRQKVIVAVSGGVDSAVAAALLKKAGYEVAGVFMRFWREPGIQKWNRCCSPDAERRAKRIAALLAIPFYVINLEREFKKRIVDYFLEGHKKGLTPNPCVVCNKEIKFGLFLEKALRLNADYIATGHYVRLQREIRNSKSEAQRLFRAKDKAKDQSYFLWQLNQRQLSKILFPIGDFTKNEVKNLAKRYKLPVLDIPQSQEICFIQTTVNDFLKRNLKQKPGFIVDNKGKIIGQHQGLAFYTIGQRKGIGLPGGPYFVLDKDLKRNFLIATKNEKDLYKKELIAEKVNWLRAPSAQCDKRSVLDRAQKVCALVSGRKLKLPLKIKAKIRYRQKLASAAIKPFNKGVIKVIFDNFQRAITPGQSVAFYQRGELLGGGIIKR